MKKLLLILLAAIAFAACDKGTETPPPPTPPVSYPQNETELKQAINKVWTFPANVDYISLEFASNNTYTLHSKKPLVRSTGEAIYLLSGKYTVGSDLREVVLTDFGKVTISDLDPDKAEVTITPTGGTATTTQLSKQEIPPPPASSDKKIKKIESYDETEGNAIIDFSYTNNKLTNIAFQFGEMSLAIPITYTAETVSFQFDGAAVGDEGVIKTTYKLNAAGLAHSSVIELNGTVVVKVSYTYNNQRQLISYQSTDGAGKFKEFCSAIWVNGNIASCYTESAHTCNANFEEYNGQKIYHHDHNGDGIFNSSDVRTRENKRYDYVYTDKVNKGGYTHTIMMPQLFSSTDVSDQFGLWCGVLGVASKNPMSVHESGDGDLSYTFDSNGYPTRIDVSYPGTSEKGWYIKQTFE